MADDSNKELLNVLKHYIIAQASFEKHGNGPASMLMRTIDIRTDESIRDNPYPSCDFYVLEKHPDGSVTREPRWYTPEAKRARFWWREVPLYVAS